MRASLKKSFTLCSTSRPSSEAGGVAILVMCTLAAVLKRTIVERPLVWEPWQVSANQLKNSTGRVRGVKQCRRWRLAVLEMLCFCFFNHLEI